MVVSSLEGIISLDPAESFETVSSANLVNLISARWHRIAPRRKSWRRTPQAVGKRAPMAAA